MLQYLYLLLFVLTFSVHAKGQGIAVKQSKPALTVRNDTSNVSLRRLDADALKTYSLQKEFKYTDTFVGTSLWDRFLHWFWGLFKTKNSTVNNLISYFLIGLGIAALIFLILKLAGVDALFIIRGKAATAPLPYNEFTENIHEMDLNSGIQSAVQHNNYRLAVRLLYLKCLKQLSDSGQIAWDINKTNHTYVNEITDTEQRRAFNILTRQFEYVWYGQFSINEKVYAQINIMFTDFKVNRA